MKRPPTKAQERVATRLDVDISSDSEAIAAARIREAVSEAVGDTRSGLPASERQIAFARSLGLGVSHDSSAVASAKISEALYERNRLALEALQLKPGDRVRKRHSVRLNGEQAEFIEEAVVSSIQPSLRVFFKGGNGKGGWPTELERVPHELPQAT